jgi:hypothetical protein
LLRAPVSFTPLLPFLLLSGIVIALLLMPLSIAAQEATPGLVLGQDANAPCAAGRLRIGDLEGADDSLSRGVEVATAKAQRQHQDARLYTLRLGCPLLTTGYQWEGTYFSETAQAFYSTDTGQIDASDDDPETIPTLTIDGLSMRPVYRSLIRAGFTDSLLLSAAGGVTIRPSTDIHPFGPPSAPRGQTYAHLAIEERGQVTDVWVSIADGTIYRYGR